MSNHKKSGRPPPAGGAVPLRGAESTLNSCRRTPTRSRIDPRFWAAYPYEGRIDPRFCISYPYEGRIDPRFRAPYPYAGRIDPRFRTAYPYNEYF